VPRCRSWASLCLSIAYDTSHDKVRIIHDGTEGYTKRIAKLPAFVDRTWSFSIDVAKETRRVIIGYGKNATDLGKPPGALKPVMSFLRPARSRVYSGKKVLRESSSQRHDKIAGAP
jgi:hypothetical protein